MGYFWQAKNTQSLHHHQSASAIRINFIAVKKNLVSLQKNYHHLAELCKVLKNGSKKKLASPSQTTELLPKTELKKNKLKNISIYKINAMLRWVPGNHIFVFGSSVKATQNAYYFVGVLCS